MGGGGGRNDCVVGGCLECRCGGYMCKTTVWWADQDASVCCLIWQRIRAAFPGHPDGRLSSNFLYGQIVSCYTHAICLGLPRTASDLPRTRVTSHLGSCLDPSTAWLLSHIYPPLVGFYVFRALDHWHSAPVNRSAARVQIIPHAPNAWVCFLLSSTPSDRRDV